MSAPDTRHSLIVRLQGPRNEAAWMEFVAEYEPFLRNLIARRGVPSRHVPDVCQQVLTAIAQSVSNWQDDGRPASFRRWTSTIARNVVLKFMANETRQAGGHGGTDLIEQLNSIAVIADPRAAQRYEHELIVWAAQRVKNEFRPTSWQAFWMTLIEGRTVAEAAQELNITPGSIYMSRSRIVARIKQQIQEFI